MLQTLSGRCPLLRAVAIAGVTITCLQATPGEAQKRDVSFRLDWIYQGPNAGFMVAKDKGFYDEAGLNVDMGPGKGSGSTAQLIASKTSQFGFADGFVVGAGVAKGMELAMVGGSTGATRPPPSCSQIPASRRPRISKARASVSLQAAPSSSNGPPSSKAASSTRTRSRSSMSTPPAQFPHW